MTLDMAKHVPCNSLYYFKGGVALTDKELAERAIGPPKAVVARNTRLPEGKKSNHPCLCTLPPCACTSHLLYLPCRTSASQDI